MYLVQAGGDIKLQLENAILEIRSGRTSIATGQFHT